MRENDGQLTFLRKQESLERHTVIARINQLNYYLKTASIDRMNDPLLLVQSTDCSVYRGQNFHWNGWDNNYIKPSATTSAPPYFGDWGRRIKIHLKDSLLLLTWIEANRRTNINPFTGRVGRRLALYCKVSICFASLGFSVGFPAPFVPPTSVESIFSLCARQRCSTMGIKQFRRNGVRFELDTH